MQIINFTPITALIGGILIGFAVFLFFIFNGRFAGISTIASNVFLKNQKKLTIFYFY